MKLIKQKRIGKYKENQYYHLLESNYGYNLSFNKWYTKINSYDYSLNNNISHKFDFVIRDNGEYDLLIFNDSCGFFYYIRNLSFSDIDNYYITQLRYSL